MGGEAVFDTFESEEKFGWRVRTSAPDSLQIIDSQDLHFLRKHRRRLIENDPSEIHFFVLVLALLKRH